MTLLMAFCDYLGNCIKDVVSAPRLSCPPVMRITATKDEEDNELEYGVPSSISPKIMFASLDTFCIASYLMLRMKVSLKFGFRHCIWGPANIPSN
ncbi:putative phosphatidate phosphatase [Rosa chinensis]|uniref:Putative phosphatidate phosphatase n=1 Tax=Rosa chinensis TaxID=74649 RepID=A0A2P6RP65_ROSCH|nr:putative phosphatidate phosphatase [Rosa chinensis]